MQGADSVAGHEVIDDACTPRFARRGGRRRPPLHKRVQRCAGLLFL